MRSAPGARACTVTTSTNGSLARITANAEGKLSVNATTDVIINGVSFNELAAGMANVTTRLEAMADVMTRLEAVEAVLSRQFVPSPPPPSLPPGCPPLTPPSPPAAPPPSPPPFCKFNTAGDMAVCNWEAGAMSWNAIAARATNVRGTCAGTSSGCWCAHSQKFPPSPPYFTLRPAHPRFWPQAALQRHRVLRALLHTARRQRLERLSVGSRAQLLLGRERLRHLKLPMPVEHGLVPLERDSERSRPGVCLAVGLRAAACPLHQQPPARDLNDALTPRTPRTPRQSNTCRICSSASCGNNQWNPAGSFCEWGSVAHTYGPGQMTSASGYYCPA